MEDITNTSITHRCSSVINRIEEWKQNQTQMTLSLKPVTTQEKVSPRNVPSLQELETIRTGRLRSFSNWPHSSPSRELMSSNGWFYCNVSDRALCIYCNNICHNWTIGDDPYEVHARLAPDCPFVLSIKLPSTGSLSISNGNIKENVQARHTNMCEITRRQETFDTPAWTQTSPSIEELTQAGFSYSGTGNTVTCFFCGGSLHRWAPNDSPKVEHCRWFPDCSYAKHLCGDRLHAKIQIRNKQLQTEKNTIDKDTLIRLVNARLDLPIVQRLRKDYKLSVIKRCLEDQLKNHNDDFASDSDLIMACLILQKQIDIIQGKLENIITPSESPISDTSSENQMSDTSVASQISNAPPKISEKKVDECVVCLTEDRQLACMPCGHLTTCVSCGYALRSCPMCREKIQSFVRIYC